MKRFLKIFVPLLLTLALLISLGWYFLRFDPEFTRDILVSQARAMDKRGNYAMATWLYQLAYRQSGNDEAIALELAEQYHAMGNYTKAEFTLSNAIADGGSMDLYIALCNIYVEQNKLLDAVKMLDNVSNPAIKSQLEAIRPQAAVVSHEPGYYNQYISISFTTDSKLYVTTDGSYPSSTSAHYSEPISLGAGETVITTLCIGENGLVSPLSVLRYTIAGVIEEMTINDSAMDEAIRQQLNVSADHVLYSNELWGITELTIPNGTQDLSDLSKLPMLTRLSMDGMKFDTLAVLSNLTSLETLEISNMPLSSDDIKTIAALPSLQSLTLTRCELSGIAPLSAAKNLNYLDLSNNAIRDLTAIENMSNLVQLKLNHNAVTDLSSLSGLVRLEVLDVSYNLITTPAPLDGCIRLTDLQLSNNELTDLTGLNRLTELRVLDVSNTGLTDVSMLAANTGLTDLNLSNNSLTDISALKTLTNLTTLDFSDNQVTSLPAFDKNCPLVILKASRNQLTSMDELEGLMNLNYVMMDYNYGLTSYQPLLKCYTLVELNVLFTGIHNVDDLTIMGVLVQYSSVPTDDIPPADDDFDPLA